MSTLKVSKGKGTFMKYSIVFTSRSGNTELLAQQIRDTLNAEDCIYYGPADDAALQADRIYIGSWTTRGQMDVSCQNLIHNMHNKEIFIFGTAGFGDGESYFKEVLERSCAHINEDCKLIGTFMCLGKMPDTIKDKYLLMTKNQSTMEIFDKAKSHPDTEDLKNLRAKL